MLAPSRREPQGGGVKKPLRISLGTDHAGWPLKEAIKTWLLEHGHAVEDFGTHGPESVDYPDYCRPAGEAVASGQCDLGIVFGGSGNGEAISANKVRGVRCGLAWSVPSARLTRRHNNANVLALGARMMSEAEGIAAVQAWLEAEYEGGRHDRRLAKLEP